MAYEVSNPIRRIGPQNSNSPVFWTYADGDNLGDIDGAAYFNLEAEKLQVGDLIYAAAGDGYGLFVVLSNDGTTVDCSNATALGATDSD